MTYHIELMHQGEFTEHEIEDARNVAAFLAKHFGTRIQFEPITLKRQLDETGEFEYTVSRKHFVKVFKRA